MKVVIVDYGLGNIRSLSSTLKYIGVDEILVSNSSQEINSADKLILPGVGAFSEAMSSITNSSLDTVLTEMVIDKKKPILGICLGMQLMTEHSAEGNGASGLGFISGNVRKLSVEQSKMLKVPHVGFDQVDFSDSSRLYRGIPKGSDFYFTHSYGMQTNAEIGQGSCNYGKTFIASYEMDNIAGVQYHPELSQTNGLKLLKNFINLF